MSGATRDSGTTGRLSPPPPATPNPRRRPRGPFAAAVLALLGAVVLGAAPAVAAGGVSTTIDRSTGFPTWYEDAAGNRMEQCLDAADPFCIVLPDGGFDPTRPLSFPSNFPSEHFYSFAESELLATPGCLGTAPGRAGIRLATEGAFAGGSPAANEQMVFGRIRVRVTSGLCPNTTYEFLHPFGSETLRTNDAGAITPAVGTEDIGCLPVPPQRCDFGLATTSRVFGTAAGGGFLRWNPAAGPAAPEGYLGDPGVLHTVVGGTVRNTFEIRAAGLPIGLSTDQWTVAGKRAGSLHANRTAADFGGADVGTTSAPTRITVTNVDRVPVTITGRTATGPFAIVSGCADGTVLNRDETCAIDVTFSPAAAGRQTGQLRIASSGGVRSPLAVGLSGTGTNVGDAPAYSASATTLAFGDVRIRTVNAPHTLSITNTGSAPLRVFDAAFAPVPESSHYALGADSCTTGGSLAPTESCAIEVRFAPTLSGPQPSQLLITTNADGSPHAVDLTGRGTGGVAAVSAARNADNSFPVWFRDETGVKVEQCIDVNNPYCILNPDGFGFDPAAGPVDLGVNFPSEIFWHLVTTEPIDLPGCGGTAPGRAFWRAAMEGTFTNGAPVDGDQMGFGRIRFAAIDGLCANTEYTITHPYGIDRFTTDATGSLRRTAGTEDIGCFPLPGASCDYSLALGSRIFGGLLRWDPAVAPAAPAGHMGDPLVGHAITGAPFSIDGQPVNYVEIARADTGEVAARQDLFSVSGKYLGPLEPNAVNDSTDDRVNFGGVSILGSSEEDVTFTNTGVSDLNVTGATITGADFGVVNNECANRTLAPSARCTIRVRFAPGVTGNRSGRLTVSHSGHNSPVPVPLAGVGVAAGDTAAISFEPDGLVFSPLHVNRTSAPATVRVSNAGGRAPLEVETVEIVGQDAAAFAVFANRCTAPVDPGGACEIEVVFVPSGAGAANASLRLTDNAPGLTHSVSLRGTGSTANPAVSDAADSRNGFPQWYQDGNGVRLEACLTVENCVLLPDGFYNPANPVSFPANFPQELFYALADSEPIVTRPGCDPLNPGAPGALALSRVALEGSFVDGVPRAGDQIVFGRIRVNVRPGGLCPGAAYIAVTPYGNFPMTAGTDGSAGFTEDIGGAAGQFADALGSPVLGSFLRWDPNVLPQAPAGHLGDAATFHRVVGGTHRIANRAVNEFMITDLVGNVVVRSDRWAVAGRIAGPLVSDVHAVDFGRVSSHTTSGARTVTLTNVGTPGLSLAGVEIVGAHAGDFALASDGLGDGTCNDAGLSLGLDAVCSVRVTFTPTAEGTRTASLRVTPAGGRTLTIALTGYGDPPLRAIASISPGVLSFGTVNAGGTPTLTTTVTNTGNADLTMGPSAIGGAADYSIAASTCPSGTVLAPTRSCSITVRFTPTATGLRTGTLSINHNADASPGVVSLSGTVVAATFAVAGFDFGRVSINTTATRSVRVRNSSTLAFQVAAVSITGGPVFQTTGAGCVGVILAPGRECAFNVTFRPIRAVTYSANLTVTGDSRALPQSVVARVTGSGR